MSPAESPEDGGGGAEGEQRGTKRKISLSNCGVCGSGEAKYRCPGCLTQSCSLLCVKKHKEDSGCSGVRNKTAFVSLSHFDEMALLSDYRFLEDTGRFADGSTRDNLIRCPRTTLKTKKLITNARRMNITLKLLPITFTRSRENSTIFLGREKRFLWHLKLVFPQSSAEFTQRRVSDKQTMEQMLTAYIHPTESDPVKRQKLKMYVHAALDDVKVFMKQEGGKANCVRYHELELTKSLRENLSYKVLIEYPVLHVVLRDHWKEYPLNTPAEPAPACRGPATNGTTAAVDPEEARGVRPAPWGPCTPGVGSVPTRETTAATQHLQEKKRRIEAAEEDREEGEITDSSDEEEGVNTPCEKSREAAVSEDVPDTRGDQPASGSSEDGSAAGESAEVSVTKEDAVHAHHCPGERESADASDSREAE